MNWKDLARTMAKLGLPTLGGALAGPAGAAAGKIIADRLGAAEASPDVIQDAIAADPDALVRLREVEAEMVRAEAEHEEEMARIGTADVQHARQATGQDRVRPWLAVSAILLLIATMAAYAIIDPDDVQVWLLVIGAEIGWVGMALTFYFGTSLGSAKRAEEISSMMRYRP